VAISLVGLIVNSPAKVDTMLTAGTLLTSKHLILIKSATKTHKYLTTCSG